MRIAPALLLMAMACGGGAKSAREPEGSPVLAAPDEMKADLERARQRGAMIFRLDRATARASDAVLAGGAPEGVQGWIAVPAGATAVDVHFLSNEGGAIHEHAAVHVDGAAEPVVQRFAPAQAAADDVAAMFRARQAMSAAASAQLEQSGVRVCESTHNTVVLPDGDDYLVYLLAATTDRDELILAGHQRFRVTAAGAVTLEPMARSCVRSRPDPRVEQPLGAYVTHHLTPTPLESHVFASLDHDIPLVVATSAERGWMIKGTDIVLMSLDPQK